MLAGSARTLPRLTRSCARPSIPTIGLLELTCMDSEMAWTEVPDSPLAVESVSDVALSTADAYSPSTRKACGSGEPLNMPLLTIASDAIARPSLRPIYRNRHQPSTTAHSSITTSHSHWIQPRCTSSLAQLQHRAIPIRQTGRRGVGRSRRSRRWRSSTHR